jgi:putative Mn2+ efflux pump MntP
MKKKKDWTKIGVGVGTLALLFSLFTWIYGIPTSQSFTESTKYFSYTLVIFLGFFIYFQFFKD